MNLEDVMPLTELHMEMHGLTQRGWKCRFSRGTKQFGCCFYDKREISISKKLSEANTEERVILTILHEIAHALAGHENGHNRVWKAKCREIGGNGKRCYSSDNTVRVATQRRVQVRKVSDYVSVKGNIINKGDEVFSISRTRFGYPNMTSAVFEGYKPRNHKYPYLVRINGKLFKTAEVKLKFSSVRT